jgi:short-chain Z-isoprenyl diphosphate synthase
MNAGPETLQRGSTVLRVDPPAFSALDIDQAAIKRSLRGKRVARSQLLRFLYWIYERRLLHQLERGSMPRHVGIILDGNRRHGRRRGLGDPREIYQNGADKLNDVLDWCVEVGITAVTLWVFSTENLKRSPGEVSGILGAIEAKMAALAHDSFMHEKRIRVQAIGRLDILPVGVVAAIRAAEAATAQHDAMTLTIAAAYGGREEIVDAVCKFLKAQAKQGASLPGVIKNLTSDPSSTVRAGSREISH